MPRLACSLEPGRSLEEAIERVRLAESLGYDSVWVSHIARREPLQVLGLYGRVTDRIGLGTAVVPIMLRHPALLAMEAATLDEVTGGRLRLGLGVSHRMVVEGWYGLSLDDPIGRMREHITVVRSILRYGTAAHEGRHHTARFSFLGYRSRPDIPILMAALGPRMLRLAAEVADGVVLWMASPAYIRETVRPTLQEALAEHGRDGDDFEVVASIPLALTEDGEAGRDALRRRVLPYAQLPFYRRAIAAAGHAEDLEALDRALAGDDPAAAASALSDSFVEDYGAAGDAKTVRRKVEEYRAAGTTLPNVGPVTGFEGAGAVENVLKALRPA